MECDRAEHGRSGSSGFRRGGEGDCGVPGEDSGAVRSSGNWLCLLWIVPMLFIFEPHSKRLASNWRVSITLGSTQCEPDHRDGFLRAAEKRFLRCSSADPTIAISLRIRAHHRRPDRESEARPMSRSGELKSCEPEFESTLGSQQNSDEL